MFRIISILALILIFAVSPDVRPGEAAGNDSPVRVGSEVEFPPFAVVDENGQADGFSVDLIKAVARTMGLSVVITTGAWDEMWNNLVSGRLDILPIVAISPERKQQVDFSLTHTETFDAFFVPRGSPLIPDIKAAENKTIVVMKSDAAHHALLNRKFKGKLVLVNTIPDGLMMVASGRHDAFLCSKLIGTLAIKKHGIKYLSPGPVIPDYKRVFAFGIKKGSNELREKLNQGLLIVKSNGEYNRIYEKWLTIADPWISHRKYLAVAFFAAAAIALTSILLSAALNTLVKRRTAELAVKNQTLNQEIDKRERIEKELLNHKVNLENLIEERTNALQEKDSFFKLVIQNSPLGIGIVNSGGNLIECNEAFFTMLGYDREELLKLNFADFTHPEDLKQEQEMILEMWDGKSNSYKMEKRYIHKNGAVFWVDVSAAVIIEQGQLKLGFAFVEDITARRQTQEKLQEYSMHLEKMVEDRTRELKKIQEELLVKERLAVLGHFAGSISHEIRNPLAAVDSSAYYLKMKLGSPDKKVGLHLERITANVHKATSIIESLLNLTRMEKPKTEIHVLANVINESLNTSKIPDSVDVAANFLDEPVMVQIDPEQIRMVLKNIIKNAVQAMEGSGKLTITVKYAKSGQIELSIADTGPGILPEHIEKIFDPLFSTKIHGIGFGLSISKMIIENHGAGLRAVSVPGGGAEFIITFQHP